MFIGAYQCTSNQSFSNYDCLPRSTPCGCPVIWQSEELFSSGGAGVVFVGVVSSNELLSKLSDFRALRAFLFAFLKLPKQENSHFKFLKYVFQLLNCALIINNLNQYHNFQEYLHPKMATVDQLQNHKFPAVFEIL